jgi:hypothetical protein
MMNKNINALSNRMIYPHQIIIKDIVLMKKESNAGHRFSFGKQFDECMMNCYSADFQIIL